MMLLIKMVSDDEGHLFGTTEDGQTAPLSVPHAEALAGKLSEVSVDYYMEQLKDKARKDTSRYYFIGKGERRDNWGVYVIPYIEFFR